MVINSKIKEFLEPIGIDIDHGIQYLIALHFKLKTDIFTDNLKLRVNTSGILEFKEDYFTFAIPLFENQISDDKWDWVEKEYVAMFAPYGKAKNKREALACMKKLFAENPDIRKEDVLGATAMYLNSKPLSESKYVRLPHYFISKDKGVNRTQDILDWIDLYVTQKRNQPLKEDLDEFNSLR